MIGLPSNVVNYLSIVYDLILWSYQVLLQSQKQVEEGTHFDLKFFVMTTKEQVKRILPRTCTARFVRLNSFGHDRQF